MLNTRDIRDIVFSTKQAFDRLHKVECEFQLVSEPVFWRLARKSKIIDFEERNNVSLKIGGLTLHGKIDTIIFSKDVLNRLNLDKDDFSALVLHELYHVMNKKKVRNNFKCCLISEEKVDKLFHEEFPELAKRLDKLES